MIENPSSPHLTPAERELLLTDPRDYFGVTRFQKNIRLIDPDQTHLWEENTRDCFFEKGAQSLFAMSLVEMARSRAGMILIANKKGDEATDTMIISGLEDNKISAVYFMLQILMSRTPLFQRPKLMEYLKGELPSFHKKGGDTIAGELAIYGMKLIPERSPDTRVHINKIPHGYDENSKPSPEQERLLCQLLEAAATRIDRSNYELRVKILFDQIARTNRMYGVNYQGVLRSFVDSILPMAWSRLYTSGELSWEDSTYDIKGISFDIKSLIRNPIATLGELRANLLSQEVVKPPRVGHLFECSPRAQFVPLSDIVGGPALDSWTDVLNTPGDEDKTFRLALDFQKGTKELDRTLTDIPLDEVYGNYFLTRDGRHRMAALKVLGVRYLPFLVTRFE